MAIVNNNRRNGGSPIKGVIKGQKPVCEIQFFRWNTPQLTEIETIEVSSADSRGVNGSPAEQRVGESKSYVRVDNDIIRCAIHKNKNSSSNGFSIVLKRGHTEGGGVIAGSPEKQIDYLDLINPGDWVAIFMRDDGAISFTNDENSGLKMIGIIENIRYVETEDPNTGRPRLEFIVTGRDFGKVLENPIYFNPFVSSSQSIQSIIGANFINKAEKQVRDSESRNAFYSPDQMIKNLLNFYYGTTQSSGAGINTTTQLWYVPKGVSYLFGNKIAQSSVPFSALLNTDRVGLQKFSGGKFTGTDNLLGVTLPINIPSQGSIYEVLQTFSNPMLNEIIVDLVNDNGKLVPAIQVRQKPFSNKSNSGVSVFKASPNKALETSVPEDSKTFITDLPRHEIQSTDIKQKNIGRNDFERVNAITVTPSTFIGINSTPRYESYTMALSIPSIQRYGLKLMRDTTIYGTLAKDSNAFNFFAKQSVSLMTDWYFLSHMLYNGTIVTEGTNDLVELGQNLYITDINQLFHVEGVSYTYSIEPNRGSISYTSEFRVSRGQSVTPAGVADAITPSGLSENGGKNRAITVVSSSLENIRNNSKTKKGR